MKGKNVLVIAGNSGIGLETVKILRNQDANVFVTARNQDNLNEFPGLDVEYWDAQSNEKIANMPEILHGLVYCPGTINLKPFRSIKEDDLKRDWEINFLGAVKALQQAYLPLKKAQGASVVLYSTVAVSQGMAFHASVAAAKGAIEGLTRTLAAEWANLYIRVNAIAPSLTDTPLAERLISSEERRKSNADRHPLKRLGDPREIAAMTRFLLCGDTSWVTGQIFKVDGGMSAIQ